MITFSPQNYTVQLSAYLKFKYLKFTALTGFINKLEVLFFLQSAEFDGNSSPNPANTEWLKNENVEI